VNEVAAIFDKTGLLVSLKLTGRRTADLLCN